MNKKLDEKVMDQEVQSIMNRIQKYEAKREKKKQYKPLLLVASIASLFLLPLFLKDSSSYGITQVSANEYKLNIFGDEVYFRLFALVENPNQISLDDEVYYYEDFQKYQEVTSQLDVSMIEIEEELFLKVSNGDEFLEYLYVSNYSDYQRAAVWLDEDFENFEEEMQKILEIVKVYPYVEVRPEEELCTLFEPHPDSNQLSKKELEGYLWFKDLNQTFCSSEIIDEFEFALYLDGTVEHIGKIDNIGTSNGRTYTNNEVFPVGFYKESPSIIWEGKGQNNIEVTTHKYYFENEQGVEGAVGIKIDLGECDSDLLDIKILVEDNEVSQSLYFNQGQVIYVLPTILSDIESYSSVGEENGEMVRYNSYWLLTKVEITNNQTGQLLFEETFSSSMAF